ncbi:hypothetical protein P7K49_008927 [Saguinus oedipus]|uniref:Uncharacterized protein n=1 Tax=Saguinus oedipus TaxID=9490 RepID=A0ABQ9VZ54_SAGOE|nr:hypothetical protein P7K49_008927 [Saguinus oedipus]
MGRGVDGRGRFFKLRRDNGCDFCCTENKGEFAIKDEINIQAEDSSSVADEDFYAEMVSKLSFHTKDKLLSMKNFMLQDSYSEAIYIIMCKWGEQRQSRNRYAKSKLEVTEWRVIFNLIA